MKKLLLTLAILGGIGLFTVPVFATTAVPWSIKNVTDTFFNPSTFNGNNLRLLVGTTTEPTTATYNDLIDAASSTNDFISIGVWNQSSGNCATSEYDANSNASTLTNNFTALGITGGGFTGIGCTNTPYTGFGANSTYLLNPNNNVLFALGTTSSKAVFDWFGGGYASSNILMTLTQPGYLGIGTTTPNHLLTISGSDTNTSLTSTNIVEENIINQNSSVNNNTADFALNTADTNGVVVTGSKLASVFTSHTPGAVSADLVFLTRNAGTLSEKLRITSTGNIIVSNFTGGTVNSGPAGTLYTSATTTATCTGNASCSPFTVFGSTPVAINVSAGTAASSTLLGDSNTFSGNDTFNNLITGSISGNAGTATKLATGRTIAITGDLAYTSPSFDGSGNVTAAGTLATVNSNVGTFTNVTATVNAKGLVTAISNGTAPVTAVTATYPILSSGGTTPVISTAFGTTSTWGLGNNGFVVTGPTGIPSVAASSTLSLPNTALQNSSFTVNGTSISLGGSGTVTANTTNALTFNNGGAGAVSGTTFNGGTAQTISYNTIGAQVAGTYVTSLAVATANGLAGSSSGGATPTLTLSTNVTGVVKANGTAFSAAANGTDYSLITALTCGAGQFFQQATAAGVFTCGTPASGAAYPFTPSTFGINVSASSTPFYLAGLITGTSTIGTLVASSSITNQSVKSALVLNGATGLEGAYGGTNPCSANQALISLNALGAGTCGSTYLTAALTSIGNGLATTTGPVIGLATSTVSFNGLTVADGISLSGTTFTITPLWSGTLNSAGLTATGVTGTTCTNCNLTYNAQGQITVAANGSAGGTPGGSNGQIQYNNSSSFGGWINSFINSAAGWLGIGTTTPQWLTDFATSTAPQLALSSNSTNGNFHWTFNNIFGNLFLATSSASTFATSTNSNPNTGFIEFPNNGGCVGCTDIVLPEGINLRNAKFIDATTTNVAATTLTDVYTAPSGRRALVESAFMNSLTSGTTITFSSWLKSSGTYYRLTATSSAGALLAGHSVGIILDPGESIAIYESTASPNYLSYNIIEYDASVPFFSAKTFNPSSATTTLYVAPVGITSEIINCNTPTVITTLVTGVCMSNANLSGAPTTLAVTLFGVKSGQVASYQVNPLNAQSAPTGVALNTVTLATLRSVGSMFARNSGDSIQVAPTNGASLAGSNSVFWLDVVEH